MAIPTQIRLIGCRQHNLKNISVSIPKHAITVLTGVSGSGKSSLAFDTLFAEGQRRYLEYFSAQTHAWIKQIAKPEVDLIEGLSPTLAAGQRRYDLSPRGTIATYTEIYDFFSILFATTGEQHCPATGKRLLRQSRQEIVESMLKDYPNGARIQLLAPISLKKETIEQAITRLQQMGFIRLKIGEEEWMAETPLPLAPPVSQIDVVIDRLEMKEGIRERLATSIETALDLSQGILKVQEGRSGPTRYLTEIYVCPETGLSFAPLRSADFNFNSSHGACPLCHGLGGWEKMTTDKKNSSENMPFIDWEICSSCKGARLKPESLACLIQGQNIAELCSQSISQLLSSIHHWRFTGQAAHISSEIIPQIEARLHLLERVGLGYLELNRRGKTLSDGEAQRVQLASQIGAQLSGLIYILDEPSLGLHRQDMEHLVQVIHDLKDLGNTIVLVEHERSLISQADHIIELGPGAGSYGGEITFQGSFNQLKEDSRSWTGQWLTGKKRFPQPPRRKSKQGWLQLTNASLHNLKDINVKIPLGCLVGFCGVSGSGKSTLALDLIGHQVHQLLSGDAPPQNIRGDLPFKRLVRSQKQAERFSARSIPATYVGLMTPLRQLFAETRLAKARGYTASRFSLNKRGGRCEACEGLGQIKVNMELMSDLFMPCDVCLGLGYNFETLQILWEGRNMADVLALSIEEAAQVFRNIPTLAPSLQLMHALGLGYLTLGQHFNTLSSGEVQRLKLAADLVVKNAEKTLYILDEPSAGLHFEDILKLVEILHRLVDQGHSVFVIEHHLDLIRQTDWVIELGPGAGPNGGKIVFEGTPAQLSKAPTPTGKVLTDSAG